MSKYHKHIIPDATEFEIREIPDPDDYSYVVTQIIQDEKNGKLFSINLPCVFGCVSDAMKYIKLVADLTCDELTLVPSVVVYDVDGKDVDVEYLVDYAINECEGCTK